MKVTLLHYTAPPVVVGVEQTIYYHALSMARAGYTVHVLTGDGEPFGRPMHLPSIHGLPSAPLRRSPDVRCVPRLARSPSEPWVAAQRARVHSLSS